MIKRLVVFYNSQEKFSFYSITFSLALIALSSGFIFYNYFKLPSQIPLFYSFPWGEDQLRPLPQLFVLPLLSILILIMNILLSWQLHPSQIVLKRIIYFSILLITLIFAITCFKIINIFT